MNKKFFLAIFMVLLALVLVVGCGGDAKEPAAPEQPPTDSQPAGDAEPEEPQQEADAGGDMVFVSSADKAGCEDCHGTLTASIEKIEGHPQMEFAALTDCTPCHAEGDLALGKFLHASHYVGGNELAGSCVSCHKLAEEGTLPVAGLEAEGTKFITIEVASVDKSPAGCQDCHSDLSEVIKNIEGHPEVPVENVAACVPCHAEGGPLALGAFMHKAHLQAESYKNLGNSCMNCHAQETGMAVKGL